MNDVIMQQLFELSGKVGKIAEMVVGVKEATVKLETKYDEIVEKLLEIKRDVGTLDGRTEKDGTTVNVEQKADTNITGTQGDVNATQSYGN